MNLEPCFKLNDNNKFQLVVLTSRVSHPPTMLRPSPKFPLQISMEVSLPATTGQLKGSEDAEVDASQSDCPVVCMVVRDGEEEEETGRVGEGAEEVERGNGMDAGRGKAEEGERLLEWLMDSLTVTRCLRINLDT